MKIPSGYFLNSNGRINPERRESCLSEKRKPAEIPKRKKSNFAVNLVLKGAYHLLSALLNALDRRNRLSESVPACVLEALRGNAGEMFFQRLFRARCLVVSALRARGLFASLLKMKSSKSAKKVYFSEAEGYPYTL